MTEKELIKNLKSYGKEFRNQTKISEDQKKTGWSYIYSKIERDFNTVQVKVKTSLIARLAEIIIAQRLILKPVASFSLVLVLFVVFSFATVNASQNTLPGNPLYNFKVVAEKMKYVLAFSEESRAKMSLDIAKRRADEFTALVSRIDNGSNKESQITATHVSVQIKNHLVNVKDKFVKMNSEESSKKVLAMAETINKDIQDIQDKINKIEDTGLKDNAKDVLKEVGDIKLVVLAALVEMQEADNSDLSKEELGQVKEAIDLLDNVDDVSGPEVKELEEIVIKKDLSVDGEVVTTTESIIDPFFAEEAWSLEQKEDKEFEIKIQ